MLPRMAVPESHLIWYIVILLVLLCAARVAAGDVIVLNDGTTLEGKVHNRGDHWTVEDANGKETDIPIDQIKSFTVGGPIADGDNPAEEQEKLNSLRHAADNLSDPSEVVARYQRLVGSLPAGAIQDDAKKDLAQWQDRVSQHEVKVGQRWITQTERRQLLANRIPTAARIGQLLKEGRLQEAEDILQESLDLDPTDASAWYLQGVCLGMQDDLAGARQAFEKSDKLIPNNAATLNNLGVMLWRQRFFAAAMLQYDNAMSASPIGRADEIILHNAAEALHWMPEESLNSPPVLRGEKLFAEQDRVLQQTMAARGLQRWGSTFVPANELPRLQAAEDDHRQRLTMIEGDIETLQQQIVSAKNQIDSDEQGINKLTQQVGAPVYSTGAFVQVGSQAELSTLQSDAQNMEAAKRNEESQLIELQHRASLIAQDFPEAPFTDLHILVGPEGTPLNPSSLLP